MAVEIRVLQDSVLKEDEFRVGYEGYMGGLMDRVLNDDLGKVEEVRLWPEYLRETISVMTEYMLLHAQAAARTHLPSDRFWGVYLIGSSQGQSPRLVDLDLLSVGNMGDALDFTESCSQLGIYPFAFFDLTDVFEGDDLPAEFNGGLGVDTSLFKYASIPSVPTLTDVRDLNLKVVKFSDEDEKVPSGLDEFESGFDVTSQGIQLRRTQLIRLVVEKVTMEQYENDRFYR